MIKYIPYHKKIWESSPNGLISGLWITIICPDILSYCDLPVKGAKQTTGDGFSVDPQVELILTRAIDSLAANGVTPDRDMWLKQAEEVRTTTNGFIEKSIENP